MTHVYSQSNSPPSKSPNLKWKEKLGAYLLARTTAYQTKVKENNPILLTPLYPFRSKRKYLSLCEQASKKLGTNRLHQGPIFRTGTQKPRANPKQQ